VSALWAACEAAAATAGRVTGSWVVDEVAIDTRTLPERALFVALHGEHRDGHAFAGAALERGAVVMVARRDPAWGEGAPVLEVADTQAGLEALGRAARARSSARIAAVTGSVGKTSTKEALRRVLGAQAPTHASAASHNNHWGVPLSLARLPRDAMYGVFELGMNHAGEIRQLTHMTRPHVALITKIAPAHLEFLGSIEAIADAKAEILEGLEPGGTAVLPADDAQLPRLLGHARRTGCRVVTFGASAGADWRLTGVELDPTASRVTVRHGGRAIEASVGAPGRHWALNATGVLAVAAALGADVEAAARALAGVEPPAGRGTRRDVAVAGGAATLLDESYNANPASVRAALDVLGAQPGRKVAVLGDMLELGPEAPAMHAALAEAVEAARVDTVHTCGPLMAALHAALPASRRGRHAADSAALAAEVAAMLAPGDVVLVKGSLGSRMRRIVDALGAQGG
jgi:UDP-N-acetylmuramoyl-tripeptide--D-alanyl-D-alanine ligase